MATRTLYFDESGFTGHNLLDPAQPIFVLASSDIETDAARQVLQRSFPRYRGAEFKFSNVWRSSHKRGLVEFGRHLDSLHHHTFIWIIDKRFCVLTKIVDFLIEPYITDAGFDFYADGFCWKYTNYIHFGLTQFASPQALERLLNAYQAFSRNPSDDALRILQLRLAALAEAAEHPVQVFLEQMALGVRLSPNITISERFKDRMNCTLSACSHPSPTGERPLPKTSPLFMTCPPTFFRHLDIWERLTNEHVPAQPYPLGDGTTVEYPLRVVSTTAVDSRDSPSIQFCDICAGLAARHFNPRLVPTNRRLVDEALEAGFSSLDYNGIRPDHIFPDQIPPRRRTGPDSVERMTEIIFGPRNPPHEL